MSAGAVYTQGGAHSATVAHTYAFTAGQTGGETASGVYTATAADRAGNQATAYFTVTRDALAPTAVLTVPQRAATGTLPASWLATDAGSGVASYDLESSVDGGAWQRLLTATISTTYEYPAELDHRHAFRVRAFLFRHD